MLQRSRFAIAQLGDTNRPTAAAQPSPSPSVPLPPRLAEPPSYLWLVLMPLIPLLGGGFTYLKRRLLPLSVREWDRLMIVGITYLPLMGLALAGVTAFVAYGLLRGHLKQPALEALERIIDRKHQTLDSWFTQQRQALQTLANTTTVQTKAVALLQSNGAAASTAQALDDYLSDFEGFGTSCPTITLLDRQGIVVFATDSRWQGRQRPRVSGVTRPLAAPPYLYISPLTEQPHMTLKAPIVNDGGEFVGVLAVDLDLGDLHTRIHQPLPDPLTVDRSWGLQTETYLVGQPPQLEQAILPGHPQGRADASAHRHRFTRVSSWAVQRVLAGIDGSGTYLNHDNIPVIGAFRWADQYNLALVAELTQAQVFQPARQLTTGILGGGIVLTAVLSVGLYPLKRRLQRRVDKAVKQFPPSSIKSSSH
ncbi:cache domain-containing protein [Halomicronema hongdechloris]|nr:cache domain-containing protein [Halomicronema hongdechloris]